MPQDHQLAFHIVVQQVLLNGRRVAALLALERGERAVEDPLFKPGLFTRSGFDGVDEGRVDASMAVAAVSA